MKKTSIILLSFLGFITNQNASDYDLNECMNKFSKLSLNKTESSKNNFSKNRSVKRKKPCSGFYQYGRLENEIKKPQFVFHKNNIQEEIYINSKKKINKENENKDNNKNRNKKKILLKNILSELFSENNN